MDSGFRVSVSCVVWKIVPPTFSLITGGKVVSSAVIGPMAELESVEEVDTFLLDPDLRSDKPKLMSVERKEVKTDKGL